ncbi:MAG: SURF1 family protein [Alphaproteobacteria bacterium]|nr:SURF1 family protein [Alphaproteobacteria bacterium]
MQFRPTLWPTLIAIPAIAILVVFGYWQVQRLQWKTELIAERQIRAAAPPIPLPTDIRIAPEDLIFRRVKLSGYYMHESELHLLNQVRDGVPGINLFTPFVRLDGGGTLLVNRGWVPMNWPGTPVQGDDLAIVEITGVVRSENLPGWLTPANEPGRNAWYFVDLTDMSLAAGILPFTDYYIYATGEKNLSTEAVPELAPIPNEWRVDLPNNHLMYAITWFSLAGILFVIYVVYHSGRRDPDDD